MDFYTILYQSPNILISNVSSKGQPLCLDQQLNCIQVRILFVYETKTNPTDIVNKKFIRVIHQDYLYTFLYRHSGFNPYITKHAKGTV